MISIKLSQESFTNDKEETIGYVKIAVIDTSKIGPMEDRILDDPRDIVVARLNVNKDDKQTFNALLRKLGFIVGKTDKPKENIQYCEVIFS